MIRITAIAQRGFNGPALIRNQAKAPTTVELTFHDITTETAVALGDSVRNMGYIVEVTHERTVTEVLS